MIVNKLLNGWFAEVNGLLWASTRNATQNCLKFSIRKKRLTMQRSIINKHVCYEYARIR